MDSAQHCQDQAEECRDLIKKRKAKMKPRSSKIFAQVGRDLPAKLTDITRSCANKAAA